ncbi:MAG: sulfatase [Myxococcota bacterium]
MRRASLFALFTVLLALGDARAVTFRELFGELRSESPATRFDALLTLELEEHPKTAMALDQARAQGFFAGSAVGEAAAEFLARKLTGAPLVSAESVQSDALGVLLISIDTLRADHLGAYGYARETSPAIDGLVRRGAVFEQAFSPSSWTLPAHMSIFTSLYPSFHKLEKGGRLGSVRLDESEPTLAELLRGAGFATAGLVAHPFLSGEWGFERGFDLYRRYSTDAQLQARRAQLWLEWQRFQVDRGLASARFFLFLHFIDPHEPYEAPSPYREMFYPDYEGAHRPSDKFVTLYSQRDFDRPEDLRYAIALYDGEIRFVDDAIGEILTTLATLGWQDSTLVIVTSDHGEEFKDHGGMGHKNTLYREELHVPLILSAPQRIAPGQRRAEPASLLDLMPTLLELVGVPLPERAQGVSLWSYLRPIAPTSEERASVPARTHLYAELGPLESAWEREYVRRAIQGSRYKLIRNLLPGGIVRRELYRITDDPAERHDRYASEASSPAVQDLERRLESFAVRGLAYRPGASERNALEIPPEIREKLRALGYLD